MPDQAKPDRNRRLDQIGQYADQLTELARRYDRLRWMAEKDDSSDAFVALAEQAGSMTTASLQGLANLLEILWVGVGKVDEP